MIFLIIAILLLGCIVLYGFVTYQTFRLRAIFFSSTWNWSAAAYTFALIGVLWQGANFVWAWVSRPLAVPHITLRLVLNLSLVFITTYGFLICKAVSNYRLRNGLQKLHSMEWARSENEERGGN